MSSSLPLPLKFPTLSLLRQKLSASPPNHSPFPPISNRSPSGLTIRSCTHASLSPSNPSGSDLEEQRWLREEQRWLREEQRWLREEQRWNAERESLLLEISELKLAIRALESRDSPSTDSVSETLARVVALLQVLKDSDRGKGNRIAESGASAEAMVLEAEEREEVKDVVVEELARVSGDGGEEKMVKQEQKKMRVTLRKGSEGEDVQAMQEALQKLGFYSGEEDMEYSSFLSGTERAVKTWQATIGAPQDGVMTTELLDRLYMGQILAVNANPKGNDVFVPPKDDSNGAAIAAVTEISESQQAVVQQGSAAEINVSRQRVFLLGENRWEEPSRISSRDKRIGGTQTKDGATKCVACRGEGRLLCMECDGTGEPNIEPQFLEWVDEGMKCPYCEGLGFTVCDVCNGAK